jgi:hypothetical protein
VLAEGQGAVALDALVVARGHSEAS